MTPLGTVVSIETTVLDDLYFLQFDSIGTNSNPLPDPPAPHACDAGGPAGRVGRRSAHLR